jgi:hypothetical protein
MRRVVSLALMAVLFASAGSLADSTAVRPDRIVLSGTLEGQMRYIRFANSAQASSDAASDLYLRILEIGIETSFSNWLAAIAILNSEWIGDYVNAGDERLTVDEIHFDIEPASVPLYFVFGKRTQPFGVFESNLISDPMTQDAHETKKVAATIGCRGPFGVEASFTAYKGSEGMDHLFQAKLFDTTVVGRNSLEIDNVGSWIASITVAPFHDSLTVFASFASEPGALRRNMTIDAGLSLKIPFLPHVTIDGEYMKALRRERYADAGREYHEGVLALSLTYSFVLKRGMIESRGLYKARKAYRRSHPVMVALRFERFDDDSLTRELGAWSIKDRYLGGGRYTIFEQGSVSAYLGLEYRRTRYRYPLGAGGAIRDRNDELYLNGGLDF